MRVLTLLYHDVVQSGAPDSTGRKGSAPATFKLDLDAFRRHVAAIAHATRTQPRTVLDVLDGRTTAVPWLLTFDDGGSSAYDPVAGLLEDLGWRGHFLVTTDCIGTAGFLSADQIRDLRQRGHVIGSHSCSHPARMSACSFEQLLEEWTVSAQTLSEIVGNPVTVASVPGGYYSRRVAEAAAVAGMRALFTSEPTTRCATVDGCLILGRYSIRSGTPARVPAALVAGRRMPLMRQWVFWETKKAAKRVLGGRVYLKVRELLLGSY